MHDTRPCHTNVCKAFPKQPCHNGEWAHSQLLIIWSFIVFFFSIYFVAFSKQVSIFFWRYPSWTWMHVLHRKENNNKKNPHLLSQLSVRLLNTDRVIHHCFILQLFKIGNSDIEWWEASSPCPCLSKGRLHDEEPAFLILCKRTCSLALRVNIHQNWGDSDSVTHTQSISLWNAVSQPVWEKWKFRDLNIFLLILFFFLLMMMMIVQLMHEIKLNLC